MVPHVSVTLLRRRTCYKDAEVGWKDVMRYVILIAAAAIAVFAIWHPAPRPAGFSTFVTADGALARAAASRSASSAVDEAIPKTTSRKRKRRQGHHRVHKARSRHLKRYLMMQAIDVNRADADTLAHLPGLGPALAERIVAFREINGPFARLDELLDVSGVTPGHLDRIAPYLILSGNQQQ